MSYNTKLISTVCLTVLIFAASMQAQDIHTAAATGDLNKVKALLEADSSLLESKDNIGNTPLITACLTKQVTVANFLIDKGADVNAYGQFRFTPLIWACNVADQDTALLQRLIDKGADVNSPAVGYSKNTPLHRAAFRGGLKVVKFLIDHGAQVNVQGYNGVTPLHRAAQTGNLQVAKLLIDHGADINAYDKYNGPVGQGDISGTILHVAISDGHSPNDEVAKFLVESGAKLNKKDLNGNTELHMAAFRGYAELARVLIGHGADVNAVNASNRTALYYAAKHGYRSVADVLIAAGANESTIVEINYGKAPQLAGTFVEGEAYLWYMGNQGYAVKTKKHLLIFNPRGISESPEAGLANGHINPNEISDQKITMLITEPQIRQYGTEIFTLAKRIQGVYFVINYIPTDGSTKNLDTSSYRLANPNESISVGGVQVHTIPSMGGGMGYLVEADGVKIVHAGLHVSDNKASNVIKFRKEIDFLKPFGPIDFAILNVWGHNNIVGGTAFEPYIFLLDQLSPKAVYLLGENGPQHSKCREVLKSRNVPVFSPEGVGERFHYLRDSIQK